MDSVTHVWRRDKKLFREAIAVNRFVLSQSRRATRKTAAGNPPRRSRERQRRASEVSYQDVYTSINSNDRRRRRRRRAMVIGKKSSIYAVSRRFESDRAMRMAAPVCGHTLSYTNNYCITLRNLHRSSGALIDASGHPEGVKKNFRRRPLLDRFASNLREFAQNSKTRRRRARRSAYSKTCASAHANRSMSAAFFVSVAHTSNAFSYCGYSSPSAKPATIFSPARRSTTSCAATGRTTATS